MEARWRVVKVPEITVYFWIIKVLTTGMGETTSDYFIHRVGVSNTKALVVVASLAGTILIASLVAQFRVRRYVPGVYWFALVAVSVFGTMAADGVHAELGVPYVVSTVFFALVLAGIFAVWHATERTLSIHSIFTPRREAFYWAVVLATFALGTAAGDMTAFSLHLGFLTSGILFGVLFAIPGIGCRWFSLGEVFAFWFAYVVTRPLGASFADLFAAPRDLGGHGWGFGPVSIVLGIVIAGLVAYMTVSGKDSPRIERETAEARSRGVVSLRR